MLAVFTSLDKGEEAYKAAERLTLEGNSEETPPDPETGSYEKAIQMFGGMARPR